MSTRVAAVVHWTRVHGDGFGPGRVNAQPATMH
jgi:hypothetical protein